MNYMLYFEYNQDNHKSVDKGLLVEKSTNRTIKTWIISCSVFIFSKDNVNLQRGSRVI